MWWDFRSSSQAGPWSPEGLEDPLPRQLVPSAGSGQQASVPLHRDLTTGCLSVLTTWLLDSSKQAMPDGTCNDFYNLALKGTLLHFLNRLVIVQEKPYFVGERPTQWCQYQERGSLGTILEAGYHHSIEQDLELKVGIGCVFGGGAVVEEWGAGSGM